MSDAVERLRAQLVDAEEDRAQYGLDGEAVRVMRGLEDACSSVASWSEECLDYSDPARVAVRAFLAKAGGK